MSSESEPQPQEGRGQDQQPAGWQEGAASLIASVLAAVAQQRAIKARGRR